MPIKEPAMRGVHIQRNMGAIHESPPRACAARAMHAVHTSAGRPMCTAEGGPEEVAPWDRCHALRRSNFFIGIRKEL